MARGGTFFVVIAVCIAVTQAGFLDWFRSKANQGHSICKVDFEVLDPQGLRLWTAHKPELKMFGIEVYINPTGRSNEPAICSLCRNTTKATHGKYFLQDDNVIVKKGDVLEYIAITDNGMTTQRHKPRKIVVNEYIIKPMGRCACPAPVVTSTIHESNPSAEIELLERVITSLSNRCAQGLVSNYLFLQVDNADGPVNLLERVKKYFETNPALKPYIGAITSAEDYSDGIAFQVKSIVDKLKILELTHTGNDILDYDQTSIIGKLDIRISD
ncbi:uncharacterized protein LOC134217446 [Armigeres subalbatus]|uniref:uncharacterized protein LOC134217446 n=1 Tax=Armigeres subalbatus TaxID=124917 RepID=UPI002ED3496D